MADNFSSAGSGRGDALDGLIESDAAWRHRWHDRLGRGPAETEGRFYERLFAALRQGPGSSNERLRELAKRLQEQEHNRDRRNVLHSLNDFDTCPHPDCVLVRPGSPALATPPAEHCCGFCKHRWEGMAAPEICGNCYREFQALRRDAPQDLKAWREQDEALQAICRECGDDEHVACPADVVKLVRETLNGFHPGSPALATPQADRQSDRLIQDCHDFVVSTLNAHRASEVWGYGRKLKERLAVHLAARRQLVCAPENRVNNPALEGCTGNGRPSCTATECMFGVSVVNGKMVASSPALADPPAEAASAVSTAHASAPNTASPRVVPSGEDSGLVLIDNDVWVGRDGNRVVLPGVVSVRRENEPDVAEVERDTLKMWRCAALLKDRTRRAIRERITAGENHMDIADDFDVPLAFVTHLGAWQMFGYEEPALADAPQQQLPRAKQCSKCMRVTMMAQSFCGYCGLSFNRPALSEQPKETP